MTTSRSLVSYKPYMDPSIKNSVLFDSQDLMSCEKAMPVRSMVKTTTPHAGPFNSNPISFRVTKSLGVSRFQHSWLSIQMENVAPNVGTVYPLAAPLLIKDLKISLTGTESWSAEYTGEVLWRNLIRLSTEDDREAYLARDAAHIDASNTWIPNGFDLALNTSRTFMVPLVGTVLDLVNPMLLSGEVHVELTFNEAADTVSSGAEYPTLIKTQLHFDTLMDHRTDGPLKTIYKNPEVVHWHPYVDYRRNTYPVTLTDGEDQDILLNNIKGVLFGMTIAIKSSLSKTNHEFVDYTPLTGTNGLEIEGTIDLLDAAHRSVLGSEPMTAHDSRFRVPAKHGLPDAAPFQEDRALYYVSFARCIKDALQRGRRTGEAVSDGQLTLRLHPSSDAFGTFSSGSYNVVLTTWHLRSAAFNQGHFAIAK